MDKKSPKNAIEERRPSAPKVRLSNENLHKDAANNRLEVETDLLMSNYCNVKLKGLRYYKVSEVLSSPMQKQVYIDTNYASRTKTSFKSNLNLATNETGFNRKQS